MILISFTYWTFLGYTCDNNRYTMNTMKLCENDKVASFVVFANDESAVE